MSTVAAPGETPSHFAELEVMRKKLDLSNRSQLSNGKMVEIECKQNLATLVVYRVMYMEIIDIFEC